MIERNLSVAHLPSGIGRVPVAASGEARRSGFIGFVRNRPMVACLLFVGMASALFLVLPGLDILASDLFHRARGGFWLRRNAALSVFRSTNDALIALTVVALLASLAIKLARPEKPSPIRPNAIVFLLSTAVVGPLLLVNVILKNGWGRPRPIEVDVFGGDAPYVEVWRITDWCDRNCSFVSGEASSATWLIAVALVLPKRIRVPAIVAAAIYAGLLSLNRVAFGGHFLSDVLISVGITLLVVAVMRWIVIERPPPWISNEALEEGLTRFGRRLRR
ncbi:MAG TPA: phosphatase PAP2 family protein [Bauldia sp.]|nr:phosphatase PAP2 family protein [Bauldia sp.]